MTERGGADCDETCRRPNASPRHSHSLRIELGRDRIHQCLDPVGNKTWVIQTPQNAPLRTKVLIPTWTRSPVVSWYFTRMELS